MKITDGNVITTEDIAMTPAESERPRRTRRPQRKSPDGSTAYAAYVVEKPFEVRIDIDNLRIRTGPGTDRGITGNYTGRGTFTIVETSDGMGSNEGWGKLADGRGWISLDYCQRV